MTGPTPEPPDSQLPTFRDKIRRILFGKPRDLADRSLFHRISLVAFLAWVGIGADGLSSSAYGPAEAYLALGQHKYLALALMIAVPLTVLVIASSYSRIIDKFPYGGGGYALATKLLGPWPGAVSGCALVVDYVLTITVSIAAAGDAIFSLLPPHWIGAKFPIEIGIILLAIGLNIRGVKEAILPMVPVFLLFLITHAVLILAGIIREVPHVAQTASDLGSDFQNGLSTLGLWGMFVIFIRAYSQGAGTYTGIEAVSNGVAIMRHPQVQTAKRTMAYMAVSLAVTAAGLLLCFLLADVQADPGKTLNAVLAEHTVAGVPGGWIFVWALLISEAAILVVAAQAGFVDGPRVLANMALDGWVPKRFATLSERLTTQNGIMLMGLGAVSALMVAGGHLHTLIVMYAINVFITFTISMAAMLKHSIAEARRKRIHARRDIALFSVGLTLCITILTGTAIIKFQEGAWITIIVTASFVALCGLIRMEYQHVRRLVSELSRKFTLPQSIPASAAPKFDPSKPTAAVLVSGYSGLGVRTMMGAMSLFGGYFKNVLFVSVGVIDTGVFKGHEEMEALTRDTQRSLEQYVQTANRLGLPAEYRMHVGIDAVTELEQLCVKVAAELPKVTFFAGQLIFQREQWYHRVLHNQTAYALQKRLQWNGIPMLILPIRAR